MYYTINEETARRAKEAMSHDSYVPGTATREYHAEVDAAGVIAEAQKKKVSHYYHDKIDGLFERYCRRLADWHNDYNRNAASCPSILVCGGSNFPVGKKKKQNAREASLMAEYNQIVDILNQIKAVGTGPVDLTDPNARAILSDRIKEAEQESEMMKKVNAYWRKYGRVTGCPDLPDGIAKQLQRAVEDRNSRNNYREPPFKAYQLTSAREKANRCKKRLAELDALEEERNHPSKPIPFDGGQILCNAAANRVQISFDEKPDDETRCNLKKHGFHWSPSNGVWQRPMTENAVRAAKDVLGI